MKNFQLFIHRYYDTIKLIMLAVLLILGSVTIVNQLAINARQDAQQAQTVKDIIQSVQSENESQTDIINRQFKALCVIIIETSGQEGLSQLDTQTQERCRNLASNNFESFGTDEAASLPSSEGDQPAVEPAASTQPVTAPEQKQAAAPRQDETPLTVQPNPVLDTLNAIINLPRRVIGG